MGHSAERPTGTGSLSPLTKSNSSRTAAESIGATLPSCKLRKDNQNSSYLREPTIPSITGAYMRSDN